MCVFLLPVQWGEDLLKQTEELDRQIQTKDNVISKLREEMEPLQQTANKKLEMADAVSEVTTFTAACGFMCRYFECLSNFL